MTFVAALVGALALFDFEDAEFRKQYPNCSEKCAVGGDWSCCIREAKPVEFALPVHDLTPYQAIVIDVVTVGDSDTDRLFFSFNNKTGGVRDAVLSVVGGGYERWKVTMNWWPDEIRKDAVDSIRFWLENPTGRAECYIDNITLLKSGEELPPAPPMFQTMKAQAATESVARIVERNRVAHAKAFAEFARDCAAKGQRTESAYYFGEASSMEKILPRGRNMPRALDVRQGLEVGLAQDEKEAVQLLVAPRAGDLKQVSVVATGFEGLPLEAIECRVMGYVQTTVPPPYKVFEGTNTVEQVAEVGWWPDPILDYLKATDVKGQDVQSFWIRIRCPETQKPGVYRGRLVVRADGKDDEEIPLSVRVYDFAVPKQAPYPQTCTFSPGPNTQNEGPQTVERAKRLRQDPLAPCNIWKRHVTEWGDFLADYYITMDNLYHRDDLSKGSIRFDVLRRLKEQGRLGYFNLGYWSEPKALDEATKASWRSNTIDRLKICYAKAKALGLSDRAYIYGCDESAKEKFQRIQWALDELKRNFPTVPLYTTAYDDDFGVDSPLSKMDWFTPLTSAYDPKKAELSRRAGHRVWWYICCGPGAPYANMFIECPAIEGRVLMGMQAVKYRPDGFLYYQLTLWNSERPITSTYAFTDWTARSWTKVNGDGSWTCCGPDGTPLATQRLENYRDGIEDYAYAMELERQLKAHPDHPLAAQAKELLEVREVKSMSEFTREPKTVLAWRRAMAETIEALKTPAATSRWNEAKGYWEPNEDEAKVSPYVLEDPLVFNSGRRVESVLDWPARRQEILDIFASRMFGTEPPKPEKVNWELVNARDDALAGYAKRRIYRMTFTADKTGPAMTWGLWLPRHAKGAVPVVLFLNYRGIQEIDADPDIPLCRGWSRCRPALGVPEHQATEATRGALQKADNPSHLPIQSILARGYAILSASYIDVSPDPDPYGADGVDQYPYATTNGVFALWGPRDESRTDNVTSIGAWAWALSRGLDLAIAQPEIDRWRTVVTGCSRLGKAAFLAAARDPRFAVCVPNQCGGGGVCLGKRDFGANVSTEVAMFSHWYCRKYRDYAANPAGLMDFDMHLLLSAIAPRRVLVEGFGPNSWMDTYGEYLAVRAASPAWNFWGLGGLPDVGFPEYYDTSAIGNYLGYVRRTEGQGISAYDWKWALDFADAAWKNLHPQARCFQKPFWYDIVARRQAEVRAAQGKIVDIVLVGDSITYNWEKEKGGAAAYAELTNAYSVVNVGVPSDRTDDIAWRCRNGNLDGYRARHVMVFSGTNDIWQEPAEKTIVRIARLLDVVAEKQPGSKIVLMAPFPLGNDPIPAERLRSEELKRLMKELGERRGCIWMDFGDKLMENDGSIRKDVRPDEVHIGPFGYQCWLEALRRVVDRPDDIVCHGAWERLENVLRTTLKDCEITCARKGDPVIMDEKSPVLVAFRDRMRRKWPDRNVDFYHLNSSTDARHLQKLGKPMLILGVDARGAHTPDEHVILSSLDEYAELVGSALAEDFYSGRISDE